MAVMGQISSFVFFVLTCSNLTNCLILSSHAFSAKMMVWLKKLDVAHKIEYKIDELEKELTKTKKNRR